MEDKRKKALIAVNTIGFMNFLLEDIVILRKWGYEVIVAADNRTNEENTLREIKARGAEFVDIWCDFKSPLSKVNVESFKRYRALVRKEKFDAIICHTPIVGAMVRLSASGLRRHGSKVIYMSHGLSWNVLSDTKTRMKFRAIESMCSSMTDAIIVINEEDFREASKMHCPNVYKVDGVGTNVSAYRDCKVDRADKSRELGIPEGKIVVMAIGRLSALKNYQVIVKALASLEDTDRYVFVICGHEVGEAGVRESIEELAEAGGVELVFAGFRRDVAEVVHCADIGVIPSLKEGLGLAGVQQLCAGVPVVGTAVQGIKEYVKDGLTGFTVANPYDVKGFAEAIRRLSNPDLRLTMRPYCLEIVDRFSKEKAVAARHEIYQKIFNPQL